MPLFKFTVSTTLQTKFVEAETEAEAWDEMWKSHWNPPTCSVKAARRDETIECAEEGTKPTIGNLKLSIRARNCLLLAGITDFEELVGMTERQMGTLRNCGPVTVREIKERLAIRGFSFSPENA